MKFERDPDLARWLELLNTSDTSFQWDRWNLEKLQKHRVTKTEVEEILSLPFVLGGRIIEPYHPENRWILFGATEKSRRLTLIFTVRDDRIRPISCRAMRRKEKVMYETTLKRQTTG